MKLFVSALVALTFAVACFSQGGRQLVVWSGAVDCGFKKAIVATDVVACNSLDTKRGAVSTIRLNDVALAVAFVEHEDYLVTAVHLTNLSSEILQFDSDLWGAAHFKTRAGYFGGEKPVVAETSIPSRDIVRGLARETRIENSLGTFMGDVTQTVEVREVRRNDGTRVRTTVVVADKEAQAAAERQNVNRTESLAAEQRRIRSTALTAKSISAGGSQRGLVYFRRVKNIEFVLFSIAVGDKVFVFQLPKTKPK